jgi:preprotein translocase subunit SecG
VLAYVVLGAALAVALFLVVRAFLQRKREDRGGRGRAGRGSGAGASQEEQESALAKAPQGWWSDRRRAPPPEG